MVQPLIQDRPIVRVHQFTDRIDAAPQLPGCISQMLDESARHRDLAADEVPVPGAITRRLEGHAKGLFAHLQGNVRLPLRGNIAERDLKATRYRTHVHIEPAVDIGLKELETHRRAVGCGTVELRPAQRVN